jgi:hypothetical protein
MCTQWHCSSRTGQRSQTWLNQQWFSYEVKKPWISENVVEIQFLTSNILFPFFGDKVWLSSLLWPWTHDLPASTSPVLGLQTCMVTPVYFLNYVNWVKNTSYRISVQSGCILGNRKKVHLIAQVSLCYQWLSAGFYCFPLIYLFS